MDIQKFFGYGSGVNKSLSAHLCYPSDMSTDQDWIRSETNFCRIRTGSDSNFFENWRIKTGSGSENFCCFNVIILKISKILVIIRFHMFAKW